MDDKTTDALDLLMTKPARAQVHHAGNDKKKPLPPVKEAAPCICRVEGKIKWQNLGCRACVPTIAPLVNQQKGNMP